jgi:hypothetical protein
MCLRQQDFVAAEGLTFQTRDIAASGVYPIRQLLLYQKDFGWMAFLGVEPRSVEVALAEGLCDLGKGESLFLKASVIGEAGRAPFELYPDICLTTEEKHGKPQSM